MSNTSIPRGAPALPSYASRCGIQKRVFSPSTISCTPSVQPGITSSRPNVAGCVADDGAVEHLAVGRPARVVHGDVAGRSRMVRAGARLQHLVGEARGGSLGVGRRCGDVGRRDGRRRRRSRAARCRRRACPWAIGLALIRELLRDPQAALFADDHQLHAFAPALDHLVDAERVRLAARDASCRTSFRRSSSPCSAR